MTTTVRYPGGPERIGVPRSEPLGPVPPGAVPRCGGAPGRTPAGGGPSTHRRRARVAVFTDNDFAKVNGVTTALSALLRYAPPGVEPCVYTHSDRTAERPGYVAMPAPGIGLPFYREMRVYLPRLWALCARVRADGIDLIHLTTPGPMGLAALHVAATLGLPLIGSFHTDLGGYVGILSGSARLERWLRLYMRWLYGRCERIFVPSAATGAMLVEDRIEPSRIALWVRGVDAEAFSPRRRSAALRHAWGGGADAPGAPVVLLYAGRVSKEKGLSLLPDVAARLGRAGVAHRWVIVGDGAYRPELERRLPGAVFTGTLDRRDVARSMASADVFVFPSCTDTAGNVVLEAQACGLPVVVSDQGGPRENMQAGVTGRVSRGGDAGDLADAVIDLASSRARRGAMSAAARRYAESRRWEQAFAPLYDAYREVAAQPRSARPRPAASPRRRAPVLNAGRCDPTARAVLADVVRRPRHHLIARWNWKAALLSAGLRGLVFFAATRSSGLDAARTALAVEFAYRVAATGCFAALTQAFSRATPGWAATAIVIVAIPAAAHVLQYGVHRLAGTVELDRGMAASVAFTVVSAAFTLYAMRRGVFIVGDPGRRPFWRDLADMPGLVAGFVIAIGRGAWRCVTRSGGASRMGRLA